MKIGIGNDHVAVELKQEIIKHLENKGHEIIDFGTNASDRFDYPKSAFIVASAVVGKQVEKGIVICGTGGGISIAANKVKGIRCILCSEPYTAKLSVEHNNTNMLAFGARVIGVELAKMIVDAWLEATFEGGRHERRVKMISLIEDELFNKE